MSRPRVLILRGHQSNPWDLRPWELLADQFDVTALVTGSNVHELGRLDVGHARARSMRDMFPGGRAGEFAAAVVGDRYLRPSRHFASADIVHAAELSFWFSAQAARDKPRYGYKLVLTTWETIPFRDSYRTRGARRNRAIVLERADLFLAATERASNALLIEGVPIEQIAVCPPGIDVDRFSAATPEPAPKEHVILSPGRLVWEKGHQDVIRAVAALHRGMVTGPASERLTPTLVIVGAGSERQRLAAHAHELGVGDFVELHSTVPYDEMPDVYARASCMVLASLPAASGALPGGRPVLFWEEQFGMVLAEAMAARLPILASRSGAIPEVAGPTATYFDPGDWMGLAIALARGALIQPPGTRTPYPRERLEELSTRASAERLAAAYQRLLAT